MRALRGTFIGDLDSGLAAAGSAAGDRYVDVLGAEVARQCHDAGLLDEILVFIAPPAPHATSIWPRVVR
jgi:dihydrofolate reductase